MATRSPLLQLKMPTALAWSPDGKALALQLTGVDGGELRMVNLADGAHTLVVPHIPPYRLFRERADLRWSADGRELRYCAGRQFWDVDVISLETRLSFDGSLLGELVQPTPDQRNFSFVRDGELWLQGSAAPAQPITQGEGFHFQGWELLTRLAQWPLWSPDGRMVAYLSPLAHGYKVQIVSTADGVVRSLIPDDDVWKHLQLTWSPDSQWLSISRLSTDFRRKELLLYNLETRREQLILAESDPRWVDQNNDPGHAVTWSRDSSQIAYLGYEGGWRHLHVFRLDARQPRQLTAGDYNCFMAAWLPNSRELVVLSNCGQLQGRRLDLITAAGGEPRALTTAGTICASGWRAGQPLLRLSPDGSRLAFAHSSPDEPPGVSVINLAESQVQQLLYSSRREHAPTARIGQLHPVEVHSVDGLTVPGVLLHARGIDRTTKHPALIYAYGAWGQHALLGWDHALTNLLFHDLAHQGYIVLIVDPRGSVGYGEAYAKAQFLEGGSGQCADIRAGADFLTSLEYVDAQRIGLAGISYGGYLALQSLCLFPDVFAAGIAIAPVTNWEVYARDSAYAQLRFGVAREQPGVLRERSPITHVGTLQAPLLLLHGVEDINVPLRQSESLVSALMDAGKEFEYMAYPDEGHVWTKPGTLRDFHGRAIRFLNRHLGGG